MDLLRTALIQVRQYLAWLPDPVAALLILLFAALLALILHRLLRALARRLFAVRYPILFSTLSRLRGLTRLALLILAMLIGLSVAPIDSDTAGLIARVMVMAIIALIGWGAAAGLQIAAELYLRRFSIDVADNLLARKHLTQVRVLVRTADVLIAVITIGAMLMTFDAVRQYGYSLFASAGVAGIVAGLAARPVLSNLFAGVQLAMTQPIRLDDAVIVEGEWGTIEEIRSTYVVVKIWDWRRMIVPLTYFIEKPFQNWTRESSKLIGTVLFYLDYRAPIGIIREKLKEICENSKNWNGEVMALQVTEFHESTMQVRAIMSGNTGGQTFDLRCEVREKMIDFLQREHPEALPRQRNELAATSVPSEKPQVQGGDVVGAASRDKPPA